MEQPTWIILMDFDDTQIPTAYRFAETDLRCAQIITCSLRPRPPNPSDLFAAHREIDSALVTSEGYGFRRYVDSWLHTYARFAAESRCPQDSAVVDLIERAVDDIHRGPFIPFDGVTETLLALRNEKHDLHIISAGDPAFQRPKIAASGLEPMFTSVHVTPHGKRPVMESIIGSRRKRVMMVGDSLRNDIAPAIEIGIVAVHVPGDSWSHGRMQIDPNSYRRITSLTELPALILALEALIAQET